MEDNLDDNKPNIDDAVEMGSFQAFTVVYGILCTLSVLTLIVDIVITAMGLLSTIGGVLSIGIPIFAIIFFAWLTVISLQSYDELRIKTDPPKLMTRFNSEARYKKPPYQAHEYDLSRVDE